MQKAPRSKPTKKSQNIAEPISFEREQPSGKLEFDVPSAFSQAFLELGAGAEVKEKQLSLQNNPVQRVMNTPARASQNRGRPQSRVPPRDNKINQEDMQPKTLRLNNRGGSSGARQSRVEERQGRVDDRRSQKARPAKSRRQPVMGVMAERTSGRATKNPPRSDYEVYKPPSRRKKRTAKTPETLDDGFRVDDGGFPDPTPTSNRNTAAQVQQSTASPLPPAARRNTSRTVRIEVQLENYQDCVYQMQPTVNTTLREIKNFIAKDILEPELLKGKYKGKDILGDSLTLDEIGIRDGERLNLFVHEEKLNEAAPTAGRTPNTIMPVSPDPEGTLLKPAANSTTGIQILVTRGRVYDDGSSLPANIKILVLNVYEKAKYCEVMWKGELRKIQITKTKIVASPQAKRKAPRANDYEEFNAPPTGDRATRSAGRKLSADDVESFRGRLKQKMWSTSFQSRKKDSRNVDEYKQERSSNASYRDLLDETSPVDLVRKLEAIDDSTAPRRPYSNYDDDDPDFSASSSEG